MFVCLLTDVVGQRPLEAVEDEPALLPGLDLPSHLDQVALAHLLRDDDVVAGVDAVARRLHVRAQVELLLPDGQVARHWPSLLQETETLMKLLTDFKKLKTPNMSEL